MYCNFITSIFLKFMVIRASSNVLEDECVNDSLPPTIANHWCQRNKLLIEKCREVSPWLLDLSQLPNWQSSLLSDLKKLWQTAITLREYSPLTRRKIVSPPNKDIQSFFHQKITHVAILLESCLVTTLCPSPSSPNF